MINTSISEESTPQHGDTVVSELADARAPSLAQIKTILSEDQFSESGLKHLSAESARSLIQLLLRGEKHGELVRKIFNAVSESNLEKINKVISTLSSYTGSFSILSQFLAHVGVEDPYKATSNAQLLILPSDELPTVRGASGHILQGMTYCAYAPGAPISSIGYFSKKQAITKIFEAFNPERMSSVSQEQTRTRRSSTLREALKDLTLAELSSSAGAASDLHSPLIARNLEVYKELRSAIESCHEHLSDLVYGGEVVLSALKSFKVKEDPGRQFFGWFEEHIKENPNVPKGILIAYLSLKDADVHLSREEEKSFMQGLLSYQRLHSYINKKVALGGLIKDLDQYSALPTGHPLSLDDKVHRARVQIQEAAHQGSNEMTLVDFAKMLELSGMVQFRRQMNQRIYDLYKEDLQKALKHFEFVSFKDGKWREDALEDSVPMERLKKHLYGAKVGVKEADAKADKKQAVLGQKDFRAIMDLQFLTRLNTDHDKFLTAMPISDFRQMIEGVVAAYRKASFLDQQLEQYMKTPVGAALTITIDDIAGTLSQWNPRLLIGRFQPIEAEYELIPEGNETASDLREVALRLASRPFSIVQYSSPHYDQFIKHRFEITEGASLGLCSEETRKILHDLKPKTEQLIDAKLYSEERDRALKLCMNPLVVQPGFKAQEILNHAYVFPKELELIKNLLTIEDAITEQTNGNQARVNAIAGKLQQYYGHQFFQYEVRFDRGYNRMFIVRKDFEAFATPQIHQFEGQQIKYYKLEDVERGLQSLGDNYVLTKSLPREWFKKAEYICSKEAREILTKARLGLVDYETYKTVRTMNIFLEQYVAKSFVDKVAELYQMRPNT